MHKRFICALLAISSLALLLTGCGPAKNVKEDPYQIKVDGPPHESPENIGRQPQPKYEPLSRYGNHSPYEVNGKTYRVLDSSQGYRARGNASWYGRKFHGRKTSSGEVYDMFEFSAAHRELPLPTYLEVTNLDNGRSVIVRVNDRGPFHDNRILDLSYAAAERLDIVRAGVAPVEIRAINVLTAGNGQGEVWLQVGAFSERSTAQRIQRQLERNAIRPVQVTAVRRNGRRLWRVRTGPYDNARQLRRAEQSINAMGLGPVVQVGGQ